jgi:hypothetical protein
MRKLSAALATASRPGLQTDESIWGTPKAAEALAAVAPPPSAKVSMEPMGASITGRRTGRPSSLEVVSIVETFRSTRGRKAIESSAWRLRRSVVSVSAPPIK